MRAVFVLAALLSFAVPQLSWAAIEVSSAATSSMSLGSPPPATEVGRAIAKTDKAFSSGGFISAPAPVRLLPSTSCELIVSSIPESPSVDLEGPPLAPRPPPLSW